MPSLKSVFSLSENRLKLGSILVSIGRSLYIFSAINRADFLQIQFSVIESSEDICCCAFLGVLNVFEIILKIFTGCTIQAFSFKFAGMSYFIILNCDDTCISIYDFS